MEYKIYQEEYPEDFNPRDWDNLGTMVCWHRNYILGDEQPTRTLGEYLSGMLDDYGVERLDRNGFYTQQWEDFIYDLENDDPDSIRKAWDLLDDKIFVLPLYLYDHSGLTINTSGFHCPWDAGQVGFIYVTRDDILKEYGRTNLSSKLIDKVKSVLRAEVETYDQYLRS
jgi:hypothetical protein